MTNPIGESSIPSRSAASARSAIESALRRHADAVARAHQPAGESAGGVTRADGFGAALASGIEKLDAAVGGTDQLAESVISGKVEEFHEVALRLKQSELSFRFAMEVRNKLVDAYREVMRMSV